LANLEITLLTYLLYWGQGKVGGIEKSIIFEAGLLFEQTPHT